MGLTLCEAFAWEQDHAKLALKLKKFKEQQMRKADEHLMQVLTMLDTVEWETQQMMVLEGLKTGNSILNEMHKVRRRPRSGRQRPACGQAIEWLCLGMERMSVV